MTITRSLRLAATALLLSAPLVHAENLDVLMSQVFPEAQATYIGYESVEDRDLIRQLSDSGYDMVSVAFDRRSQFDCL